MTSQPVLNKIPTPNLGGQKVCAPVVSIPVQTTAPVHGSGTYPQQVTAGVPTVVATATMPTYPATQGIAAQGYVTDPVVLPVNPASAQKPGSSSVQNKSKSSSSKKKVVKKNTPAPVLPKADQPPGNLPTIMPKVVQTGAQPQVLQNQQMLQEVVYQTVDQQNPESKVLVKALLAQKLRTGNVIIQQPMTGVVNVQNMDLGASGDGQTIQYQTSFPQNVQQTAYIQYPAAASSAQTSVQTIMHQGQPTSQVQTFVVQPSTEMYVQGQLPTSSLTNQQQLITQQQMVVSQQPMMVSQQPMMVSQQPLLVSQQQVMVSQQPVIVAQQPMVVSQTQFISQPQMITQSQQLVQQSQFIPQQQTIVPTSQVIIQPQSSLPSSQMALSSSTTVSTTESLPSTVSSVVLQQTSTSLSISSSSVTTTTNSSIKNTNDSASQLMLHSTEENLSSEENNPTDIGFHTNKDTCQNDISKSTGENISDSLDESVKPSNSENENNSAFIVPENAGESVEPGLSNTEASAEIESAVGSIMEESNDNTDTQDEEPVMIENDGNELMFEQQKYQIDNGGVSTTTEIYVGDEAAMAVEQLNQMEQEDDDVDNSGMLVVNNSSVDDDNEDCDTVEEPMEVNENPSDQILNDQTMEVCADSVVYKEGSVEKESQMSDEELIAKFRAETPINVPLVSENGLLEQDFEARMAVENLLKDVEFKVNDDDNPEMNVIYACPQQNNANALKNNNTVQDSIAPAVEETDNKDSGQSESQHTKAAIVNHKDALDTSKPLNNHPVLNGIDSEHKPLMNGDLSSPECPSVPSPGLVNGGDKLVNGISDGKNGDIDKNLVEKVLKLNGVVNHKISSNEEESKVMEVSAESEIDTCENAEEKPRTGDILAQSMIDSNIDKSEDSLDNTDKMETEKTDETKADDGDILARSILENGIQPSDCDMPDPEPTSVTGYVKQIIPNTVYGNIMTVQINNNTIPFTFTNNALIANKNSVAGQINVCNSRHLPTPEAARDGELSCDSTSSSITTSEQLVVSDKHSMKTAQSKTSQKDSKKPIGSPKAGDSKKSKSSSSSKKRSRSKSGGSSGGNDSRPSSVSSPATTPAPPPEYMCEWSQCRQ